MSNENETPVQRERFCEIDRLRIRRNAVREAAAEATKGVWLASLDLRIAQSRHAEIARHAAAVWNEEAKIQRRIVELEGAVE